MADFEIIDFNNTETEFIFSQVFGWSSGLLCFALLIPQLVHIWKYKSAKDLSYWFLGLNQCASTLFVVYAIIIGSAPILVSDTLIIIINTSLIASKYMLDKKIKKKHEIKDVSDIKEEEKDISENAV